MLSFQKLAKVTSPRNEMRILGSKVMHYFLFFSLFPKFFLCLSFNVTHTHTHTHTHTRTHTHTHKHTQISWWKVLQNIFLGMKYFFFACLYFEWYFLKSNTAEPFQRVCWVVCSVWSNSLHDFNWAFTSSTFFLSSGQLL